MSGLDEIAFGYLCPIVWRGDSVSFEAHATRYVTTRVRLNHVSDSVR